MCCGNCHWRASRSRIVLRRAIERGVEAGHHDRRCERIVGALGAGETTAYGIAADLWPEKTILEQPLLVVWEVLGHLDLLLDAGRVREQVTEDGSTYGAASFALAGTPTHAH